IEVVKGPQGTMYGVSAFAGMVQVFTHRNTVNSGTVTIGGGSFSNFDGSAGIARQLNPNWLLDVHAAGGAGDGWQDRTHSNLARGRASLSGTMGRAHLSFDLTAL